MRIAVAGSGRLAFFLMRPLMDSTHEIVAVVQNGRTHRGLKRSLITAGSYALGSLAGVTGLAAQHGAPIIWIDRMDEKDLAPLRATKPDVLLVGGFGIILKRPILDLPRIGCVNVHSSLLPKHRGPNPFSAVILAGEQKSGVTFHQMDEGIDTGNILEQHAFPVESHDTAVIVYHKACDLAGRHVVDAMDRIEREGIHGTPQDPAAASYDKKLTKPDSYINWQEPARKIDCRLRACKPFFLTRFRYRNHTVLVLQLACDETAVDAAPGTILRAKPPVRVATGQGVITLVTAYVLKPVPWIWPAPWCMPKPGEKVS
jgi:methionyl-tRNA formyltransferase